MGADHSGTIRQPYFYVALLFLLGFLPVFAFSIEGTDAEPEMMLITGGEFMMGREGYGDHSPPHTVRVSPFYMDIHEVTNAQWFAYCEATDRALPIFWGMEEFRSGPDYPRHPVVGVSWLEARNYATWRGARLPTEAEWEYAARGGLVDQKYSHGNELDSTLYAPGGEGPSPVASFPPNGFGLHDMTGNALEWVSDWYDADYYKVTPIENPTGPGSGKFHVVRGGGWHTGPMCSQVYHRTGLQSNWLDFNVGFRCVKYIGESAALTMEQRIEESDIETALALYREMKSADPADYYFNESEFNEMAYRLIGRDRTVDALEILKLNVAAFPLSFNAYDSLGEAYLKLGNKDEAIRNYRKSIELNPLNGLGRAALKKLVNE